MKDLFMMTAFVGLAAAVLAPRKNLRTGRMVFWTGTLIACVSVFLMSYPPNWQSGLAMSVFVGCAITVVAYVNTSFIKVGGRTFTFFSESGKSDGYGGGVTVKKSWWLAVVAIALVVGGALAILANGGSGWIAAGASTIIALAAISFGYRDALMGQPTAAGQKVQLGLLSLMTVSFFAVIYLGAYHASKRWVVKRQAFGRHQRKPL